VPFGCVAALCVCAVNQRNKGLEIVLYHGARPVCTMTLDEEVARLRATQHAHTHTHAEKVEWDCCCALHGQRGVVILCGWANPMVLPKHAQGALQSFSSKVDVLRLAVQ